MMATDSRRICLFPSGSDAATGSNAGAYYIRKLRLNESCVVASNGCHMQNEAWLCLLDRDVRYNLVSGARCGTEAGAAASV